MDNELLLNGFLWLIVGIPHSNSVILTRNFNKSFSYIWNYVRWNYIGRYIVNLYEAWWVYCKVGSNKENKGVA